MHLVMHLLLGLGVMKRGVPGILPFSRDSTVLIKPEIPAAGSEWPTLLFIYDHTNQ